MILKLFAFNGWYAFACGVFCLIVAPMIVDSALVSMGSSRERILENESYLLAVSFVRIAGVLLLVYAMAMRLLLRHGIDLENLRAFFALFAVGLLLWGGMFILLLSTKNPLLALVCGVGLLEWLLIPGVLLFTYKKTEEWKSVKPEE